MSDLDFDLFSMFVATENAETYMSEDPFATIQLPVHRRLRYHPQQVRTGQLRIILFFKVKTTMNNYSVQIH